MYESHSVIHVQALKKRNLFKELFFSSDRSHFIVSSESPIFQEIEESLRTHELCDINDDMFKKTWIGGQRFLVEIKLKDYEQQKEKRLKQAQKAEEEKKKREAEEIRKKQEEEQKALEEFAKQKTVESEIESFFDGYNNLRRTKVYGLYDLVPLEPETILDDIEQIKSVQNDIQTAKCMPELCGPNCAQNFSTYLENTYMCTDAGIAFAYAIRKNASFDPMSTDYSSMMGFIKITTPSHNKVTNNFDGWLIDYLMLPKYRRMGLMKLAVSRILDNLEDMGVKELYAMVDIDNLPSLRILGANKFEKSNKAGGINPNTGKPFAIVVHHFD